MFKANVVSDLLYRLIPSALIKEKASHIFISRRHYRSVSDTKSGKHREMTARLSFNTACELGFRGSLDEWERLRGSIARR
jgi:hypothetical protein